MSSRIEYEREMQNLHNEMIRLGSMVETALSKSRVALRDYDRDLCHEVIKGDDEIDHLVEKLDRECVLLIARQQPVASDLRDITSNLKLITDLERMADHAEDICELVLRMMDEGNKVEIPSELFQMIEVCRNMTGMAMDSYVMRSKEKSQAVLSMDDEVDSLYEKNRQILLDMMKKDPEKLEGYVAILTIAKHIERFADHAENVAGWVIYYLEGRFDIKDELEPM